MKHLSAMPSFESAQEAFLTCLEALVKTKGWVSGVMDPTSVGSHFGSKTRRTKELICTGFAIENPLSRLILCPSRRIDLPFAFANFIWTLGGRNDVSSIAFYNRSGEKFSDDGKHFAGALGHRMMRGNAGSQLTAVVNCLKSDPASRRAAIQFYSDSDTALRPRDTPCIFTMHFMVRDGKLIAIVHMRSQSALMVLPYDIILYSMLHELVANAIEVPLGAYYHQCDSLHLYEDELRTAESVLENSSDCVVPDAMEEMPRDSYDMLDHIIAAEARLRDTYVESADRGEPPGLALYWQKLIDVLNYRVSTIRGFKDGGELAKVDAFYRNWISP